MQVPYSRAVAGSACLPVEGGLSILEALMLCRRILSLGFGLL